MFFKVEKYGFRNGFLVNVSYRHSLHIHSNSVGTVKYASSFMLSSFDIGYKVDLSHSFYSRYRYLSLPNNFSVCSKPLIIRDVRYMVAPQFIITFGKTLTFFSGK